jgi:hypothetical protein
MTMEQLRHFFGWCALFNYALLILWFLLAITARAPLLNLCRRMFRISDETYDKLMFYGISFYKMAVILFTVMPYLALWML